MKNLLVLITAVSLCCCNGANKTKNSAEEKRLHIEIPSVPSILQGEEAAEYIATHFWDNFDFTDQDYLDNEEVTEQAYANYITILNHIPDRIGQRSMNSLMTHARADSAMYYYFFDMAEKYLYHPNSQYRNEELFIPVLQNVIAWEDVDDLMKMRPRAQLEMTLKNRVGDIAADVVITTKDGSKRTLHSIDTDYILLFFNNPDCNACAEVIAGIKESGYLMPLQNTGRLTVVAVYPDEDLTAWRNYVDKLPSNWINGYDADLVIRTKGVYDLRAIPSLYLLDHNKRVLVKEAGYVPEIEEYFYMMGR